MRRPAATALLACAAVAVVWGVLHVGWYGRDQIVDYGVYQHYGDGVVKSHQVPYRDFQVEYPPAALPLFVAPALVESFNYRYVFQTLMALCAVAIVLAAGSIGGRRAAVLAALAPLALGSVVLSRYDLWPGALAIVGLATLLRGRLQLSALLVGTAFAAKFWPAVLVPPIVLWLAATRGLQAAVAWTATATATAALWFFPFAALSAGGVGYSFHAQLARPLQLESLGGSILIALHKTTGSALHIVADFGSQNLGGTGTHAAALLTAAAEVAALLAIWTLYARRRASVDRMLAACAASVAAAVAFGKVFSPQFLIWLIPLVPLVRGRRAVPAIVLFVAALVLTQVWFPIHYWELVAFRSPYTWVLLARDLTVVALAAGLTWVVVSEHEVLGRDRARREALQRVRAQVE